MPNFLFHGDCFDACRVYSGKAPDLVYIDPPYNVGHGFSARVEPGMSRSDRDAPVAYSDDWGGLEAFLDMLSPRLAAIRDVLSPTGTLYLHLDHRSVHEAKALCDRVFGRRSYLGEIIWVPGNGSKKKMGLGVTHQTILIYAKTPDQFTWNGDDPIMREPYAATSLAMHFKNRDADGRLYRERIVNGKKYIYYADEGRKLGSVWTDCPAMSANTPLHLEATGYPTQKPESLLERIIKVSSSPGDTVADFFFGSGTTLAVASKLGRYFVGSDLGPLAVEITKKRLGEMPYVAKCLIPCEVCSEEPEPVEGNGLDLVMSLSPGA